MQSRAWPQKAVDQLLRELAVTSPQDFFPKKEREEKGKKKSVFLS